MFGSIRIIESPKVWMTCMHIKPRHSVSYFFRYIRMLVFFQRLESLYTNVFESHDIYLIVCMFVDY